MTQEEAIKILKDFHDESALFSVRTALETLYPELKESEDERIRKALIRFHKSSIDIDGIKGNDILVWLEKQEGCEYIKKEWLEHLKQSWYKEGFIDGKYSGGTSKEWTINDTTTLNELIDFLENGTAKLQHDLTRYANWLKIQFTPIEKQGEQKPIEWDADDDDKFFFLKARLKDYEDCIIYDEELSECQKHNVRETTKEFLEWLDSIKERIGG